MRKCENLHILRGFAGKDPVFKELRKDNCVARFSLATKSSWRNTAGEWNDATEWHQVEAWGKLARRVMKWIRKGDYVTCKGSVEHRKWESNGEQKEMTVTKLFDISNCDKVVLDERTEIGGLGEDGAGLPASGDGDPGPPDEDLPF